MHNVEKYYLETSKNPDLKKVIDKFSNLLISKKVIKISVNDFLETHLLIENNIIKIENDYLKISNYSFIAVSIIKHYESIFSFNYNNDFKNIIQFYNHVKEEFINDNYTLDYNVIELEFLKFLIFESNKKHGETFHIFIKKLTEEHDSEYIYEFIRAYSENLAFLEINPKTIFDNSALLLKFTKSDADYSIDEEHILRGIKLKCQVDDNIGIELFKLALKKNNTENNDIIISAIISGIYEKIGIPFYEKHLHKLIDSDKNLFEIINGLSIIDKVEEDEFDLFITLFNRFKTNKDLAIVNAKLLFKILESTYFSNKETHVEKCFIGLNEIISNEISLVFILQRTASLENYDTQRIKVLINGIQQPNFSINTHTYPIVLFFWKNHNILYLKQILITISKFHPLKKIAKHFQSRFDKFDKIEFDNMLIDLLTSNKASLRFIGLDIFNKLPYNNFNCDILKLEPIQQYKLWVSLCNTYKEPKYIVPFLIPLLKSSSATVKECFTLKLKEYSENYGGHLTDALENHLDISNKEHQEILTSIKSHMYNYHDHNINIKRDIKELNPYHSDNKAINDFNRLFDKKMSRGIRKGADTNSFLGFAKTVQLAKGGGWKHGEENEIMKLARIQTSMALPRNYFIDPNQYELEESLESLTNWKETDFKIIEKWISNE